MRPRPSINCGISSAADSNRDEQEEDGCVEQKDAKNAKRRQKKKMNDPATSLDRLHDLVLPAAVPWWPAAPGWYVVFLVVLVLLLLLVHRAWKRRQASAYRLAALRELGSLQDAAAIAELLRRTALAVAPRQVIAEKTGTAWLDWLAAQCSEIMPDAVRTQLTAGVYGRSAADRDLSVLRDYAALWIARHHMISFDDRRID
jgi:hypothetical protein